MNNELVAAAYKLAPAAAVAGSSAAGWLDQINTYGQAAVYLTGVTYTVLMIYVLVRDKILRRPDEQSDDNQAR